ncbi:MAG TPA: hypothetical protein VMI06_12760, partial [Terriglobia bacterium]|nr:hypothetical protein [Terriglobia bacterium]
ERNHPASVPRLAGTGQVSVFDPSPAKAPIGVGARRRVRGSSEKVVGKSRNYDLAVLFLNRSSKAADP